MIDARVAEQSEVNAQSRDQWKALAIERTRIIGEMHDELAARDRTIAELRGPITKSCGPR